VDDAWKPDDQPFDVEAEMSVGFGGLEERYVSRVTGRPFESVTVGRLWAQTVQSLMEVGDGIGSAVIQIARDHM
jgi:hypothetical protein